MKSDFVFSILIIYKFFLLFIKAGPSWEKGYVSGAIYTDGDLQDLMVDVSALLLSYISIHMNRRKLSNKRLE